MHYIDHHHNRGGMEIAGACVGGAYSNVGGISIAGNGAFATYYDVDCKLNGGSNNTIHIYRGDFYASRNWAGLSSTAVDGSNVGTPNSGKEGSVAKPPTVAIMWILRFI